MTRKEWQAERKNMRDVEQSVILSQSAIDQHREAIREHGWSPSGMGKTVLMGTQRRLLSNLRELQGLGVLNEADVTFMEGQVMDLTDPTAIRPGIMGGFGWNVSEDALAQLDVLQQELDARKAAGLARLGYSPTSPGGATATGAGQGDVVPLRWEDIP